MSNGVFEQNIEGSVKCVSHAIFWLPILKCHAARQLLDTLQLDTSSYYLHTSMFYTMNIVLTMVTMELHRVYNTLGYFFGFFHQRNRIYVLVFKTIPRPQPTFRVGTVAQNSQCRHQINCKILFCSTKMALNPSITFDLVNCQLYYYE